jgi:hypothetical protein
MHKMLFSVPVAKGQIRLIAGHTVFKMACNYIKAEGFCCVTK